MLGSEKAGATPAVSGFAGNRVRWLQVALHKLADLCQILVLMKTAPTQEETRVNF